MRTALLFFIMTCLCSPVKAEELKTELDEFSRIIVSPRINLILQKGDSEHVRLVYHNVDVEKINIKVNSKTLRIYLDDAKMAEKNKRNQRNEKVSIYEDAVVTAYVTYREIKHVEIRGNQELICNEPILAETFTLKAYGENEIRLASVKTGYLKANLYGENDLRIDGGKADFQKYKLYGENQIDTQNLKSYSTTATFFGDSKLKLTTNDELRVNAFGEAQVSYKGGAHVNKGLIFGRTRIIKLEPSPL